MPSNHSIAVKTVENPATQYNPLQADAYAEHLAEVNQSKQVIASANILNSQGMLLVKKGQPLSAEMVERIVQFKLLKPLETCVDIEDSLNAKKLLSIIEQTMRDDDSKSLYKAHVREEVAEFCNTFFEYPVLAQKLTVLWLQMPQEFKKSIAVSWTSLIAAQRLRLSKDERRQLFIVGLVHDIGMLHIPRDITSKTGSLTQEEWRAIKSHPVIGQKILEQVPNLPAGIAKAVLEHHEMADGTGYPAGRFGTELGVISQLVNLFDSAFAILFNKLIPKKLSTCFIAPILQINSSSYRLDVFNTVVAGLHEFQHKKKPMVPREECRAFVEKLSVDAEMLNGYRTALFAVVDMIVSSANGKGRQIQAVQTMSQQLEMLLRTSGILDKHYFVSLMQEIENATPESESDMEEAYLMLQELRWQFSKLTRICMSITESDNLLSVEQCQTFSETLNSLPKLS